MDIEKIISQMTLEEKATMLTGIDDMKTPAMEKYGIKSITMADGPHGTRLTKDQNCTHFPNLCSLAASWDTEIAEKIIERKHEANITVASSYLRSQGTLNILKKSDLADIPIQNVTKDDLQDFFNSIKNYSNSYLSKIFQLVKL